MSYQSRQQVIVKNISLDSGKVFSPIMF